MSRREEENRREILLAGNPQEEEDGLYAWVTEKNTGDSVKRERTLAGELMVVSYPAKYHQVILVPVNGVKGIDPARAEAYLNSIYSQAVVQFRVLAVDSFFVALKDKSGRLDNTDRNSRMDYSEEMQQVIRQWKKNVLYDPQAHYLFILGGSVDPAEAGYMPLAGGMDFCSATTGAKRNFCTPWRTSWATGYLLCVTPSAPRTVFISRKPQPTT